MITKYIITRLDNELRTAATTSTATALPPPTKSVTLITITATTTTVTDNMYDASKDDKTSSSLYLC